MKDIKLQVFKGLSEIFSYKNKMTISIILYKIIIDIFYVTTVSQIYSYEGMILDFNFLKYIISWIILLIIIIILPRNNSSGATFIHFQMIVTVIPLLTYYSCANKSSVYMILIIIIISIQIFILKGKNNVSIGVSLSSINSYISVFMIFVIPLSILFLLLESNFYGLKMFDSEFLYYVRENTQNSIAVGYISIILYSSIIPFFLLYSLERKNYFIAIILCFSNVFLFMLFGNKVIILSLILIIAVYFAQKIKSFFSIAYLGISLVILFLIIGYFIGSELEKYFNIGISFVGERFLFGPCVNKFAYFEFFNTYPHIGFADTQYANVFNLTNVYNYNVGNMITSYVRGVDFDVSNSLTGYLGESYGQFGVIGLLFTGVVVALFVKIIEISSKNIEKGIIYPLVAYWVVVLNDTAFRGTLFTCGWVILIFLFLVYNGKTKNGNTILRKDINL